MWLDSKFGCLFGSKGVVSFHPATISDITALLSPETVLKETLFLKKSRNQVYITSTEKTKRQPKARKKERNRKCFTNKDRFNKADTKWRNTNRSNDKLWCWFVFERLSWIQKHLVTKNWWNFINWKRTRKLAG